MAWWDIWEQPLSRVKEEDNDDNNTNIHMQYNNKGEEAEGKWILWFLLFFCLGFVLWWYFFLHFRLAYNFFYHNESSNYLQIKHNRKNLLQR
jgi:hypothetical protein